MGLTIEWGTNTECDGLTSITECPSAKSVAILQFNNLALRGEFHPHTSSYEKRYNIHISNMISEEISKFVQVQWNLDVLVFHIYFLKNLIILLLYAIPISDDNYIFQNPAKINRLIYGNTGFNISQGKIPIILIVIS